MAKQYHMTDEAIQEALDALSSAPAHVWRMNQAAARKITEVLDATGAGVSRAVALDDLVPNGRHSYGVVTLAPGGPYWTTCTAW